MYFAFYAPKSFCSRSFVWPMLRWFSCFIHEKLFMFRYLSFTNTPVTHFLLYVNTFHSKSFILPTLQQLIFHFVKKFISFENICFCNTVTHFYFLKIPFSLTYFLHQYHSNSIFILWQKLSVLKTLFQQ